MWVLIDFRIFERFVLKFEEAYPLLLSGLAFRTAYCFNVQVEGTFIPQTNCLN